MERCGVSGARLTVVLDRTAAATRAAGQLVAAEDAETLRLLADHDQNDAEK